MKKANTIALLLISLVLIGGNTFAQNLEGTYRYRGVDHGQILVFKKNIFKHTEIFSGDTIYGEGTYKRNGNRLKLAYRRAPDLDTSKYTTDYGAEYADEAQVKIRMKSTDGTDAGTQRVELRDKHDKLISYIYANMQGNAEIFLAKHPQLGYLTIGSLGYTKVRIPVSKFIGKNCTLYIQTRRLYKRNIEPRKTVYQVMEDDGKRLKLKSTDELYMLFLKVVKP